MSQFTLWMLVNFSCFCRRRSTFSKLKFSKNSFRKTILVPNGYVKGHANDHLSTNKPPNLYSSGRGDQGNLGQVFAWLVVRRSHSFSRRLCANSILLYMQQGTKRTDTAGE